MHLTPGFLVVAASLGRLTYALSVPPNSRYRGYFMSSRSLEPLQHAATNVVSSRNLLPRQSSQDTCIYANSTTMYSLAAPELLSDILATLDSCLCVGNLPSFFQSSLGASYPLDTPGLSEMEQTVGFYVCLIGVKRRAAITNCLGIRSPALLTPGRVPIPPAPSLCVQLMISVGSRVPRHTHLSATNASCRTPKDGRTNRLR